MQDTLSVHWGSSRGAERCLGQINSTSSALSSSPTPSRIPTTLLKGKQDRGCAGEQKDKNILFLVGPLMKLLQDQTGRGALPQPS